MKTAMEELIKELNYVNELPMISGIIKRAELLLEKEKLQIMNAHCSGWQKGKFNENNDWLSHYEETYNQNK